jgi:predicted ribosomally synthesized peptide with SipW-like signal peptide
MIDPKKGSDNMKKGNMTVFASIFVMALVASVVSVGTMAYFSDVESSTGNQIAAGTLNIEIKDSDQGWYDGTPVTASMSSPAGGLKPGDEFWTDVIKLKNVGTIDAQYIYASFNTLSCHDGANPESEWAGSPNYIADQIVLVDIWEYSPNMNGVGGSQYNPFDSTTADAWLLFWGAPQDGSISLWDIVTYAEPGGSSAKTSFRFHTGDGLDPLGSGKACHLVYPYLPVGGEVQIQFKFKLLENTDNRAQGDYCQFNVDFIASNCLSGTDLDSSF